MERFVKFMVQLSAAAGSVAIILCVTYFPLGKIAMRSAAGERELARAQETSGIAEVKGPDESCNWGLSFQDEGAAPIGNASAEYLRKFDGFYVDAGESRSMGERADTGESRGIYLTFDAGYENGCTEKILDILKEQDVKAAFFAVGNFVQENPEIIRRMAAEGHIVGNHSMHHPDMSKLGDEEFKREMEELEAEYEKVTGEKMQRFYRPPQGKYSENSLKRAKSMGYTTVFWSLAYVDWLEDKQPSREETLGILNKRIHPGAIVLLHSTSRTNAEILGELIEGWKAKGYAFKTLDQLPNENRLSC